MRSRSSELFTTTWEPTLTNTNFMKITGLLNQVFGKRQSDGKPLSDTLFTDFNNLSLHRDLLTNEDRAIFIRYYCYINHSGELGLFAEQLELSRHQCNHNALIEQLLLDFGLYRPDEKNILDMKMNHERDTNLLETALNKVRHVLLDAQLPMATA